MKLCLFETASGQISPGVIAGTGVVDIADAVPAGHTPQATMQHLIDGFTALRPALERLAREHAPLPLADVRLRAPLPRPGKILACIANYWEHGAMEARPLNMFLKNPDAVIGPGDTIVLPELTEPWIFMHEAELALVIKGPGQDGTRRGLAPRRLRLHRHDRRVRARGGPADVEGGELARQVLRHLRAHRPVHRHRGRDPRAQRHPRAVLGRRPAPPQLQHRRHGAPVPELVEFATAS